MVFGNDTIHRHQRHVLSWGLLGVLAASLFFCRRRGIGFWAFGDLLCPAIPLGYTFGRIGNFINGELYGRITTVPWGMYFPSDPSGQLRHPSQLYEGFFEGLFLFAVLWGFRRKNVFQGFFVALYLVGYGTVRFFIEFSGNRTSRWAFFSACSRPARFFALS